MIYFQGFQKIIPSTASKSFLYQATQEESVRSKKYFVGIFRVIKLFYGHPIFKGLLKFQTSN